MCVQPKEEKTSIMATIFWILPIFLALVPSGSSLSCGLCGTTRDTSCTGPSKTCLPGSACLVTYTSFEAGGYPWALYSLSCGAQRVCGITGTASLPEDGRVRMATSCCTTDNCVPELPTLPEVSSVWNGLVCPSCVNAESTFCSASMTMQCKGNETMCVTQTIKVSAISVSTAFRGCASQSLCDVFGRTNDGESEGITYTCTSGNISLKRSF
ncbi:phospholipase A2 inhibitor and Ly6/PLAUR domain-containing protein-like isoform X1 [Lithobates pipiens]